MTPKLSVLLPVYNEATTLLEILEQVRAVPLDLEIIVVDNCSQDGTRELLQEMLRHEEAQPEEGEGRLRVAFQEQNKGKGASVRRALALARGEWVIVQDADLEYDPRDFVRLLERAERRDRPQVVFGTRLRKGTRSREMQPHTAFYWGRLALTFVFRLLYGRALSDVATCYKLMRRTLALELGLQGSGFELDFEIAAKLARRGARWVEIPIFYAPRTEREGKKIRAGRDGNGRAVGVLEMASVAAMRTQGNEGAERQGRKTRMLHRAENEDIMRSRVCAPWLLRSSALLLLLFFLAGCSRTPQSSSPTNERAAREAVEADAKRAKGASDIAGRS
jgi:hypothetical protein